MREFTKRQKEIIKTAIHIISENSMYSLTMKRISSNMGISEPALYRHFKNKHDILSAILDTLEVFCKLPEYNNESSIDKIHIFLNHIYNKFEEYPEYSKIIMSDALFSEDKSLTDKLNEIKNGVRKHTLNIIREGQKNRELKNNITAESINGIIVGTTRLLITRWYIENYSFKLKEEGFELWTEIRDLIKEITPKIKKEEK